MKKKIFMLIIIVALLGGSGCGLLNYNGSTSENFDASYHVQMMLAVQEEYLRIPAIINAMSTEEKVAQLFIARFPAKMCIRDRPWPLGWPRP